MKLLFLTTVLPRKRRMGSEVASQAIISALLELGSEVSVLGYIRVGDGYALAANELSAGRRPIETSRARLHAAIWLASSLMVGAPYSVVKYRSASYVRSVRDILRRSHYDAIVIDHVQMAWIIESLPGTFHLIGLSHNVEQEMYAGFARQQHRSLKRWLYAREATLIAEMEAHFVRRVDRLWTLTSSDAAFFSEHSQSEKVQELPLPASFLPNKVQSATKDFDVGLIGSWAWGANAEGLRWFFDAIYPSLPSFLSIHVAGTGAEWLSGRYGNVTYRGFVDDAQGFLRAARAVAIPTLSGGGIQIKTLDAIASGSAVVATRLALRGIVDPPPTVTVADDPLEFAASLCLQLQDTDAGRHATRAITWSRERYRRFLFELRKSIETIANSP